MKMILIDSDGVQMGVLDELEKLTPSLLESRVLELIRSAAEENKIAMAKEPLSPAAKLNRKRRATIDSWYDQSDLNGFQVTASNGWEHSSGSDSYSRTIYVENDEEDGPSVMKVVLVNFKQDSHEIEDATIDGDDVAGSHGYKWDIPE